MEVKVKVKETRDYKLDLELSEIEFKSLMLALEFGIQKLTSEQAGAARGLLYNLNIEGKVHEENPYK